jgi:aminopeptidase YwaD
LVLKFLNQSVFTILFFTSNIGYCQDSIYARKIINELCEKKYAGRGYVNNGVNKAGNFIANEFGRIGLVPFIENSFFQPFNFSVNTFSKSQKVLLGNKTLLAGKDYLINEASGSGKHNCEIIYSEGFYQNNKNIQDLKNSILIIDEKKFPNSDSIISANINRQPIVFLTDKKFTWSVSTSANLFPLVYVKRSLLDNKTQKLSISIKNNLIENFENKNVIGYISGSVADSFVVFSAHYDHLGKMGKSAIFPGANDNASGVAMLLDLAKYYKKNPSKYSILFIAFAGEEAGLIGSKYFTENSPIDLEKIKFLINMDLMGSGKEGVTIVNGTIFKNEFDKFIEINKQKNYLPEIKKRGEAANSDHYWFSKKGVPAFFIYTLGEITAYHDVNDVASKLPLTKYNQVFMLIRDFVGGL